MGCFSATDQPTKQSHLSAVRGKHSKTGKDRVLHAMIDISFLLNKEPCKRKTQTIPLSLWSTQNGKLQPLGNPKDFWRGATLPEMVDPERKICRSVHERSLPRVEIGNVFDRRWWWWKKNLNLLVILGCPAGFVIVRMVSKSVDLTYGWTNPFTKNHGDPSTVDGINKSCDHQLIVPVSVLVVSPIYPNYLYRDFLIPGLSKSMVAWVGWMPSILQGSLHDTNPNKLLKEIAVKENLSNLPCSCSKTFIPPAKEVPFH